MLIMFNMHVHVCACVYVHVCVCMCVCMHGTPVHTAIPTPPRPPIHHPPGGPPESVKIE